MLDNVALYETAARAPDDASYVVACLEEAGMTLLALPMSGYSLSVKCGMPQVVHTAIEAYGWEVERMRVPTPSARKISEMDRTLAWISLIPVERYVLRKIVGARALVNPVTDRHLFPWRRLGRHLGADHRAVQQWHAQAIDLIVAGLRRTKFIFPS